MSLAAVRFWADLVLDVVAFPFGRFWMDVTRRVLLVDGQPVALHARAFDILEYLIASRDRVVTRDEIVTHVWRGVVVGENNLSVQLSALRRVLAVHGGRNFIVTVPHRGYQFVDDASVDEGLDTAMVPASLDPPCVGKIEQREAHDRPSKVRRWRIPSLAAVAVVLIAATIAWKEVWPNRAAPGTTSGQPFNPPPDSIAVLAFANLSSDPGADYLSDGLSEALIDTLSRVNQLQVTARTSSFFFKGKPATVSEIAHTLNVGSVLEGSLRRQGTRLRIDAHLSDSRTGYQTWSRSYDRDAEDLLKLQDDIASDVADALQTKLLETETAVGSTGGTASPRAFDAYLRGEHHILKSYDNNLDAFFGENGAAIAEFRQAVGLDRNFARALTSLSSALIERATYIMSAADPDTEKVIAEARRSAQHAAGVAPSWGLPHALIGRVLLEGLKDFSGAWDEAVHAIALTPNDATVQENVAEIAKAVGHREDAVKAASRAVSLDPLRVEAWRTMMHVLLCAGKYDEAQNALQRIIEILGNPPSYAPFIFGNILLKQGKPDEARRMCLKGEGWWTDVCLAVAYHALGRQAEAEAHRAAVYAAVGDDSSYNQAMIYAQWGQPVLAMHWLTRAREINDSALSDLECDAWLDPVRSRTDFKQIEKSLHLPPLR